MVENICHSIDLICTVIIGRKFLIKRNFFEIPCSSSLIGVYEVEKLSEPELWPISFICKNMCISSTNICFPPIAYNIIIQANF